MTTLEVLWRLLAVLLLVGANGFFVAAEFALVSADESRLAGLEERGDRLARAVRRARDDLNLYLSSCQIGITLASLGLGWIGEPAIAQTLVALFSGVPEPFDLIASHTVAVVIAFTLITYLHVVLGEVAPKALAIFHPEALSRWIVRPLVVFTRAGWPLIWSMNESANWLLRVFGVRLPTEAERVHSPEEIMVLVKRSHDVGKVERDEQAMIHGVFELTRTVAREVMTPRPDIVAVPTNVGFEEVVATAGRSGHSRLPVYRDSLDNVVGVVLAKDLLTLAGVQGPDDFDVTKIMREPYFVPDTKSVGELLAELRRLKIHMAIVVDEFGGTDGLVTLEDLIEEIVGEIYDEYDEAHPVYTTTPGGQPLIDGGAPIDEVNEKYELELPEEDYDTLGGFILGELGHVPKRGDVVRVPGAELVVERVDNRRVRLVRLLKSDEEITRTPRASRGEDGSGKVPAKD
ncbi:MAG: HlyC/CorC family transporter [Gemmatimonadota bacterium]|nr:MAG: HlyC/CorC family transporter [Gemmatimonadota bacterium]